MCRCHRRTTWCGNHGGPTRVPTASSSRGGSARRSPLPLPQRLQRAPLPAEEQASTVFPALVTARVCGFRVVLFSSRPFPSQTFRLDALKTPFARLQARVFFWGGPCLNSPVCLLSPSHLPFLPSAFVGYGATYDVLAFLFVDLCTIYLLFWNERFRRLPC